MRTPSPPSTGKTADDAGRPGPSTGKTTDAGRLEQNRGAIESSNAYGGARGLPPGRHRPY